MSELSTPDSLIIEPTFTTPAIRFEPGKRIFSISGNSYPENSLKFYSPILQWLENFVQKHTPDSNPIIVEVHMEYFNTSTAKVLLDLFRLFESLYEKGQPITVRWIYNKEDTEMEDAGLDYQAAVKMSFELVPIDEENS